MPKKQTDAAAAVQPANFETAIAELEALGQRMESGDLTLDDSLQAFERGVQLTRQCQSALKAAEQRVTLLTADGQERDFPALGEV